MGLYYRLLYKIRLIFKPSEYLELIPIFGSHNFLKLSSDYALVWFLTWIFWCAACDLDAQVSRPRW